LCSRRAKGREGAKVVLQKGVVGGEGDDILEEEEEAVLKISVHQWSF
jgi:hypothetical protein